MTAILTYLIDLRAISSKSESIIAYLSTSNSNSRDCRRLNDITKAYSSESLLVLDSSKAELRFIPQCRKDCRVFDSKYEKRSFMGAITVIGEEYGIIDDFIYFDLSCVSSFEYAGKPKVGDQVRVDAERRIQCGWKAINVFIVDNRFQTEEHAIPSDSHVLGCVSKVTDDEVIVEQGLAFPRARVKQHYRPFVGDWIKFELTKERKLDSIQPLRTKELTGTVTVGPRLDVSGNELAEGKVNDDVLLSISSCEEGYIPHRNDLVTVIAIEVKRNHYLWRAIKTKLINRTTGRDKDTILFKPSSWVLRGGFPNQKFARKSIPSFLPKYPVPVTIKQKVENGHDVVAALPALADELSIENYADRFSALTYLEEIHSDIDIRRHGIKSAQLERKGEYLCLHVPGMADGKPDLSVSDLISLHTNTIGSHMEYHGFIHHLLPENEEILLKFHADFQENFSALQTYDVEFKHSRTPYRRCHFAVRLAQRRDWSNLLFPSEAEYHRIQKANISDGLDSRIRNMMNIEYFNRGLNYRQKQAVSCILRNCGAAFSPYIIFGPPGTGKTVTLVEAILQLYFSSENNRILVCAPSNSAVDVICERIASTKKVKIGDMARFNAIRRLENSIPASVLEYCRGEEELEVTSRYRIILTTCMNSGSFYGLQLSRDHFTHVCIDEAGQSTEPETLIPIGLQTNAHIIMAGDPEQLGPVVMSPLASTYGLNTSLLERLMKMRIYQYSDKFTNGYDETLITKLVNNYRCHHKLIELPSRLFYKNELVSCKGKSKYSNLSRWNYLPKEGFPLIFHGITGQQTRESDSPSLMNPEEILQAIRYVKILIRDQNVAATDIGIVTPYKKQVQKIRMLLGGVKTVGVKVGSVEEFQGQERSVMIVSTVRSQVQNLHRENVCTRAALGFLSNYRRFNVAITRAKDLLIIIGNPNILKLDKHWNSLLIFACENGGYTGSELN